MAEQYSKQFLSGAANGLAVKVAATSSPGTTVHTAHATAKDEIYLEAYNSDSVSRELFIQFGGTTSPDDETRITLPARSGWIPVIVGRVLSNSLVVKAYCATTNVITVAGFVNRIATV